MRTKAAARKTQVKKKEEPPLPRTRLGKGKTFLPPSEQQMGGNLNFTKRAHKNRYVVLLNRKIVPSKCKDDTVIDSLPISHYPVLVRGSGWASILSNDYPIFYELTREFFATFEFHNAATLTTDTPEVIKFRLLGTTYSFSLTEFNVHCGFMDKSFVAIPEYADCPCDVPAEWDPAAYWRDVSTDPAPYNFSISRATYLKNLDLRYVHKLIAYNYSGTNEDSSKLSKTELYFLFCLEQNVKINFAAFYGRQLLAMARKKRGHLCLGSFATLIAMRLKILNLKSTDMHIACEVGPLDIDCLHRMGEVEKLPNGQFRATPSGPGFYTRIVRNKRARPTDSDDEAGPSQPWRELSSRLDRLENRLGRLEQHMDILFNHFGLPKPPL